jgi:hypothetical protein
MKSYLKVLSVLTLLLLQLPAFSQIQTQTQSQTQTGPIVPPDTDIYLANIQIEGPSVKLTEPVKITSHKGYDNQPKFLPNQNAFFYTSAVAGNQTDIYVYDLEARSNSRIAGTSDSEFSPTLMPDRKSISVIRVEPDTTQRLWKFAPNGAAPELVLENVKRVGYHAWINENTVAVYILGDPVTLQVADLRTGKTEVIAEKVGRCIQNIPGTNHISFTRSTGEKTWNIEDWDPATRKSTVITTASSDEADYAWMPDGSLLMARDSKILFWSRKQNGWKEVADFSNVGLHGITRLSVNDSGDRIALVAAE